MLEEKGWPLAVTVAGTQYSSLLDPVVNGHQYLTFSGSILTITGTLDVYYKAFRFSDVEIIDSYDRIDYIPGTSNILVTDIPDSLYYLYTSIKLLEGEFQYDAVKSARVDDGDTAFDNQSALSVRQRQLETLKQRLKEEIDNIKFSSTYNIDGVRLD